MSSSALTVYFDGACPLCAREIAYYRARAGADRIAWIDASRAGDSVAPGLCKADALARFHVRTGDGRLIDGAAAFIALWRTLPAFRPLGLVLSVPPLPWVVEAAYRAFLRVRPAIQRRVRAGRSQATSA